MEIEFIDQDYLPLARVSVWEHRESEEEIDSDDFAESSGDESEELESEDDEDLEEEEEVPAWSEEITRRDDIDFSELVGLAANVNIRSLTLSKGFFDLFSTAQVWELLVAQTNLYANQKRRAAEKSVWYPVSVEETKG